MKYLSPYYLRQEKNFKKFRIFFLKNLEDPKKSRNFASLKHRGVEQW